MDKLIEWFKGLPSVIKIALGLIVLGVVSYLVFVMLYNPDKATEVVESVSNATMEIQDAKIDDMTESKSEAYENAKFEKSMTESYWDSLSEENDENSDFFGMESVSQQSSATVPDNSTYKGESLDPHVYSEVERYFIENGIKTKAQVDQEHEQARLEAEREARQFAAQPKALTQEQQDSLYFARMERAYQLAAKYTSKEEPEEEEEPEVKEARRIDPKLLNRSQDSGHGDNICTSLEFDDNWNSFSNGSVTIYPAKATFLKTGKVIGGQRVQIRLLEDLRLASGMIVPANTHLSGICSIADRLQIHISSIRVNGNPYVVKLDAYDVDCSEGIYCPIIEKAKGSRAAKQTGRQVASGVAGLASSVLSRSRIVGGVVQSGVNELSQELLNDGSVAVNIMSGYEFYIYEDMEELSRANRN